MRAIIDGANISSMRIFAEEVGKALAAGTGGASYFGRDLNSFHDCLCGGYIGWPPYEIVIENAENMLEPWGTKAWLVTVMTCYTSGIGPRTNLRISWMKSSRPGS